jgi:hypothetical protein
MSLLSLLATLGYASCMVKCVSTGKEPEQLSEGSVGGVMGALTVTVHEPRNSPYEQLAGVSASTAEGSRHSASTQASAARERREAMSHKAWAEPAEHISQQRGPPHQFS